MKNKSIYKRYSSCVLVRGFRRSVIYDLQLGDFYFITNKLYEILYENDNLDFEIIKSNYSKDVHSIIDEYISFLIEKNVIFECEPEVAELFIDLPTEWDYPGEISSAVIELDSNTIIPLEKIINDLETLGCQDLQIKLFDKDILIGFEEKLDLFEGTIIKSIELLVESPIGYSDLYEVAESLCKKYPRIYNVIFCGTELNKNIKINPNNMGNIVLTKYSLNIGVEERKVAMLNGFIPNIFKYTEALSFNLYFNKKIYIDRLGKVKNGEYQLNNFGDVREKSILEICTTEEFKKLGNVEKDQIKVCKDCEFRYMCVDFRIPERDSDSEYFYYKNPCNYDPYKANFN